VGLIAREIEAAGVPTVTMTSAWDITAAIAPPRSVYVHAPLGHQTGVAGDDDGNRALVRNALAAGLGIEQPGQIARLPWRWPFADDWEARTYTPDHTATGEDGKPLRG
jgi:D-proline reductase (dithiol) PrdB